MHLAVALCLLPELPAGIDTARFLTGSLLVDAAPPHQRDATHFIIRQDTLRTYDLDRFRARYGSLLLTDGLVLGYYLHLLQDLMFRRFMYHIKRFDPHTPGYLNALYVDYGRLNRLLPERMGFPISWEFPETAVPLSAIADFDLPGLRDALSADLLSPGEGASTYLTLENTAEYIALAADLCRKELHALQNDLPLLDPRDGYTWHRDPMPKE